MFCNKCGRIIEEGAKFCGKCGTPVSIPTNNIINDQTNSNENVENLNKQQDLNQNYNQINSNYYNNQSNQNYDNIVNPDMKKYAIGSIVIPVISIIVYWYIGLTTYLAALLAGIGFGFAKKGRLYSKTLSTIGYILNGILVGMAILMIFIILIEKYA